MLNLTLQDLLGEMEDSRREVILNIYFEYERVFAYAAGSSHNHQAWKGGYLDHIAETLRINRLTYAALNAFRPLPFTEDSAAICLFLHDIEKPFRYGPKDHPECIKWATWHRQWCEGEDEYGDETYEGWEAAKWEIIRSFDRQFGLKLTDDEINAIKYTHGEGNDHRKDTRVAGPLAAHVHHCDNISARIYFDDGRDLG
jgi:hypothetical protein